MVVLLHCVANLKPASVDLELDGPPALRGWTGGNPDVDIQAVFILDVGNGWCGVWIVQVRVGVPVVWLRAYRPESGVVTWFSGLVECEIRWQRLWTSPS